MRLALLILAVLGRPLSSGAAELTIGLIPEQNVFHQMQRYVPLGRYIEQQTGIAVRFTLLSRYGNIIDRFTEEKMDGAFWGSFTAGLAIKKLGIEPLARPVWKDGTSTYRGFIFVRRDSGIREVADMRGKVVAFVERATTAGYVFPLAWLKEHGVSELDGYFQEYYFTGSHDAAVVAVLDRKVDIGCAKNTIYDLVATRNPRVADEIVILAESPWVPSNGLGVRPDLDSEVKAKLRKALLGMAESRVGQEVLEDFGAERFIPTTTEDYAPVFEIAERAGIDLKAYRYLNE